MPLTTNTYARVVADSVSTEGDRITTMEVRLHRFVLAEFNTHRVFSRNSASSRAIPFAKQVERVNDHPAIPLVWPAEQKGMQGGESLDLDVSKEAIDSWLNARGAAVDNAQHLADLGVHKSVVNRLLEPFMWHTIVVTSTAWSNFFEQRVSPLAQPEIRVAAEQMLQVYEESEPTRLEEGQWHLPYVHEEDWDGMSLHLDVPPGDAAIERNLAYVSAARCARVSYLTQDGKRDLEADLGLYQRLVTANPWHGSPLEHVATPWTDNRRWVYVPFEDIGGDLHTAKRLIPLFGNVLGWRQLRLEIEVAQGFTPLD